MRLHDPQHGVAPLRITRDADLRRAMEHLDHVQSAMTAHSCAHLSAAVLRDNADKLPAVQTATR